MLLAMGAIGIDLGVASGAMPRATAEVGLVDFFETAMGIRIAIEILVYSCAAGLFVVPIFAAVQAWSSVDRRARVIGAVNTLNSIYMVGGSLATTLLLKFTGIDESTALGALGGANLLAAVFFFRRLPIDLPAPWRRGTRKAPL